MSEEKKGITRRSYLKYVGTGAVVVAVAGAAAYYGTQPAPVPPPATTTSTSAPPPVTTATPTATAAPAKGDRAVQYAFGAFGLDTIDYTIKQFMGSHPDIDVTWSSYPWTTYHDKQVALFATAPEKLDCTTMLYGDLPLFAASGWALPIDDLPGVAEYKKSLVPAAIGDFTYKGKFYGAGSYWLGGKCFGYNERMIKKAGYDNPPATYDELVEQSLAIKKAKIADFPIGWSYGKVRWDSLETWFAITASMGGRLYDDALNPLFLEPSSEGYRALQFMVDCIQTHKISSAAQLSWNDTDACNSLGAGGAAFSLAHSYNFKDQNNAEVSKEGGNIKLMLWPEKGIGTVRCCPHILGKGAQLNNKIDATMTWLLYYGGEPGCRNWMVQKGLNEPIATLANDPDILAAWGEWIDVALLAKQIQNSVSVSFTACTMASAPMFAEWAEQYCTPNLQSAAIAQMSIGDALKAIAEASDNLKKQYGY